MPILLLGHKDDELSPDHLAQVKSLAPQYEILVSEDKDLITARLTEIEIVARSFPKKLLTQAPNLRWYQTWSAGVDWLVKFPDTQQADFLLTSASGVHGQPIAEHIFAFLLGFARDIPRAYRTRRQKAWDRWSREAIFELPGKTMLLVGVGAIGQKTAELAQAFQVKVIGMRRDPSKSVAHVEAMYSPSELLNILPQVDFVVNSVPLTAETRHMFGAAEFETMKDSAIFINVGRGGTVDESALISALQQGQIAGAGLDVFETEPLPEESPLWDMDNVMLTAHYSGATPYYEERAMGIFLDNLQRYLAGQPLVNMVDKKLGY